MKGDGGGDGDEGRGEDAAASVAVRLARASVLCTAGQGELVLGRGTAIASERLGEALRIREELLPSNHPATVRKRYIYEERMQASDFHGATKAATHFRRSWSSVRRCQPKTNANQVDESYNYSAARVPSGSCTTLLRAPCRTG